MGINSPPAQLAGNARYLHWVYVFVPDMNTETSTSFTLQRDAFGRLVWHGADGQSACVQPARAFPISAAGVGIGLFDAEGHEIAWIANPDELPDAERELLAQALAAREFMPVIERLEAVSSFACPSVWQVHTDRGSTSLTLKGEEDIRRMGAGALLVTDAHGVHYLIRDAERLDRRSRKLLDRFM